jgi:hypothetical protein
VVPQGSSGASSVKVRDPPSLGELIRGGFDFLLEKQMQELREIRKENTKLRKKIRRRKRRR